MNISVSRSPLHAVSWLRVTVVTVLCRKQAGCQAMLFFTLYCVGSRLRLKCDGTRAETRFLLSAKRTGPFKSAGASVQSTTGSRGVRISGSNAGYTMFQGSVKSTGYTLHSPVSPSLPLPCVSVCHHISTGLYHRPMMFHSIVIIIIRHQLGLDRPVSASSNILLRGLPSLRPFGLYRVFEKDLNDLNLVYFTY